MSVTFIDFFSGIGGFHSGFEKAGMKCVGWCEADKYAQKSYRAIYDTKGPRPSDDVRKCRGWELPTATLWSFGFPCQDVSIAGKQRGIGRGTRSGLFFEIMRLLDEKEDDKPEWIICENVKNLLSIEAGWGFFKVASEMAKRGYIVQWRLYNSKDYGVPQNRERVYIVGHLGERGGRELLPTARKSERALKKVIDGSQGDRVYEPELSCTLSSQGGGMGAKTGLYKFIDLSKKNPKITEHARCLTARYDRGISNRGGESSGVMAALTPDRIEKRQNGRRFKEPGEPMFTLTGQDRHGVLMESYPTVRIRKLTPKECWRLQGFTNEQFEKAAAVNSNTQLYKQAGNAVTVNVVEAIGRHIVRLTKEDESKREE